MKLLRDLSFPLSHAALWLCGVAAVWLLIVGSAMAQGQRVGAYDFGYASTGDSRVLPVQVFDDGVHTFFQFRAGGTLPAIFADEGEQVRLLLPQPHGPFWRVPDRHGRFLLQSGRARATVAHLGSDRPGALAWTVQSASGNPLAHPPLPLPAGPSAAARLVAPLSHAREPDDALERNSYAQPLRGDRAAWPVPVPVRSAVRPPVAAGSVAPVTPVATVTPVTPVAVTASAVAAVAVGPVPAAPAAPTAPAESVPPPMEFQVHLSDPSLRHVLVRWARSAGWTHGPDHWAVDRDLPVVAPAGPEHFGADFREAVRRLLGASELTDRPLQPCFYSNRVVRVISRGDTCSPSPQAG